MFHALSFSNANALAGASRVADRDAWTRTYRAAEHGQAYRQMRPNNLANSPPAIRSFAATFRRLQEERHRADYDPNARFIRSDVVRLIERAENAIEEFYAVGALERRRFATLTLFRER